MSQNPTYPPEVIESVIADRRNGVPLIETHKRTGIPRATLSRWLKRLVPDLIETREKRDTERKVIRELHLQGLRPCAIIRQTGFPKHVVDRAVQSLPRVGKSFQVSHQERKEMVRLFQTGMRRSAIARAMGRSTNCVYDHTKHLGPERTGKPTAGELFVRRAPLDGSRIAKLRRDCPELDWDDIAVRFDCSRSAAQNAYYRYLKAKPQENPHGPAHPAVPQGPRRSWQTGLSHHL